MRIAKWTAIVVGGLLLLLVAGAFVLTSVIDPNRYRGQVERMVTDLAGRPLVIEGDLKITWYPWLGVRMGRAHLEDRGSAQPLAEWNSVFVAAKLIPLLKGQVVVDRIRLESPRIRLRRDAQGHGNWEGLGPRSSGPGPASANPKPPPQIAGLELRDGFLDYRDEQSGTQLNLSDLNLDLGEWRAGQPLPVTTRFVVHHASLAPKGVRVELDVPALAVRLDRAVSVGAPKATLKVADARVEGDFNFDGQGTDGKGPTQLHATGSTQLRVPSLRKLAADLALNQTLPHDPTTLGALELTTRWSFADGALSAKPITLQLDGVNFNGWIERSSPPASAWTFELHGDRIDLGRYMKLDTTRTKPFEIPVDTLRAFNANGSVIFDQAVLADARMSDVRLRFQTPEAKQ